MTDEGFFIHPCLEAVILAAGRGERMRPLSDTCAKPLLLVGGESLLAHQVRFIRTVASRVSVTVAYRESDVTREALRLGCDAVLPSSVSNNAAWVRSVRWPQDDEWLAIVTADNLMGLDTQVVRRHLAEAGPDTDILLVALRPQGTDRGHRVSIDELGRPKFLPQREDEGLLLSGLHFVRRRALAAAGGGPASIESLWDQAANRGALKCVLATFDYWMAVDSPDALVEAGERIAQLKEGAEQSPQAFS